ncbi:MAG: hypothetical protein CME68_05010 [Halobacteriovoraceae bacterium]|nr:hypothetical protein [Halobacteriovoraceae bacterium]
MKLFINCQFSDGSIHKKIFAVETSSPSGDPINLYEGGNPLYRSMTGVGVRNGLVCVGSFKKIKIVNFRYND